MFLVDPNYQFANRYSLRWSGKGETVYPSTFVLDRDRIIRFAHVSHEHGDRISAAAVLRFLEKPMAAPMGAPMAAPMHK
jgi:peroxiredoxin